MNTTSFSFRAVLQRGWNLLKHHTSFIIGAGFITCVIFGFLNFSQNLLERQSFLAFILNLAIVFISIIISLGWAHVFLNLIRSHAVTWKTFRTEPELWVRYIKAYVWYIIYSFLCGLATALPGIIILAIGFFTQIVALMIIGSIIAGVAFLVVMIYFTIRYQFLRFVAIDFPELSGKKLFKHAGKMTQKDMFQLFGFGCVTALINLIGIIPFGLGLIITIPVTKLAQTAVYNYLKEREN